MKTVLKDLCSLLTGSRGLRWVIVVDHGDGYMSLYGSQPNIAQVVGEKVEAGETYRPRSAKAAGNQKLVYTLNYDIRELAINPAFWCKAGV